MIDTCILDIPYPEINPNEKSREKAMLLLPLFAGRVSEMTAINTYIYQSMITKKEDPSLHDMLECISITEMKHFDILGQIIYELGVLPKLYAPKKGSRKTQWYQGSFVDYSVLREVFLKENIKAENTSIKDYTYVKNKINNKNIEDILDRIILDERHHIEIFESLLQ
ncbi:MAG: ferritin family protein [Clostridia bacterium]|nr:ferritin family protein [Clostridia bacterium]